MRPEPTAASSARWYRRIAPVYDLGCRPLYARARRAGVEALQLHGGETVLDLCTGTGLNLPPLARAVGTAGCVVGLDFTPAMLARAEKRRRLCPAPVELIRADARELDEEMWHTRVVRRPDAVLCSFGLAVAPDWRTVFERAFDLLSPGGRFVIVDTQAIPRGIGRVVNPMLVPISNWAGHAELRRPTASLLDGLPEQQSSLHWGGYVHVTAATKPV